MNNLILVMVMSAIMIGAVWYMWRISMLAGKTHDKLNILKEEAKLAKNKEELQKVWENLKVVSEECWHKSFSSKVVEVKTIIETKYEMLP